MDDLKIVKDPIFVHENDSFGMEIYVVNSDLSHPDPTIYDWTAEIRTADDSLLHSFTSFGPNKNINLFPPIPEGPGQEAVPGYLEFEVHYSDTNWTPGRQNTLEVQVYYPGQDEKHTVIRYVNLHIRKDKNRT